MRAEARAGRRAHAGLRAALVALGVAGAAIGVAATASAAKKPPPNLSPEEQALFQYAACMRKKGVNIPDPVKGKDGKYAFPKIPDKILKAPGVAQKARECAAQLPGRGGDQGSVSGPVTSVKGSTFTVKTSMSPTGTSTVTIGSATITGQAKTSRSSLKVGTCVAATGTRDKKGVVAASRITISDPVNGQCGGGFRGRGGAPGTGTGPPPGGFGGGNGNVGFAFGSVTKISGDTLTVKSSFGQTTRTTTVTLSSKTALTRTVRAKASAIKVDLCAFVRGTSTDKGVTVKATSISLAPRVNGACARIA